MVAADPENGAGTETPVDQLSYTAASRELDAIVAFFEQRDVDVDQLVSRLERATALVGELDKRLRRTRVQVEQLVPRLAAVLADGSPDDEQPPAGAEGGHGGAPGHGPVGARTGRRAVVMTEVETEIEEVVVEDAPPRTPASDSDHPTMFP